MYKQMKMKIDLALVPENNVVSNNTQKQKWELGG